jgi:hypothetical protein
MAPRLDRGQCSGPPHSKTKYMNGPTGDSERSEGRETLNIRVVVSLPSSRHSTRHPTRG